MRRGLLRKLIANVPSSPIAETFIDDTARRALLGAVGEVKIAEAT